MSQDLKTIKNYFCLPNSNDSSDGQHEKHGKCTYNALKMHLKAQVDFTSRHDFPYSADLATVSKLCFIVLFWCEPLEFLIWGQSTAICGVTAGTPVLDFGHTWFSMEFSLSLVAYLSRY